MSKMRHPPVDLGLQRNISSERLLAEETFAILQTYGGDVTQKLGSFVLWLRESEEVDLRAQDNTDIAFRIRSVPCLVVDTKESSTEDSPCNAPDYYVMDIQQTMIPDVEDITDVSYEWKSYIKIITASADLNNIELLDGTTYEKLCGPDIVTAHNIINLMRQELRGMFCEKELADVAGYQAASIAALIKSKPVVGGIVREFAEYNPGDFCANGEYETQS